MAINAYRSVYSKFWNDDVKVVETFTPQDKYFFLYLLTNPHTNLCGCYEIPIKQISLETGYDIEKVKELLDRMEQVHQVIARDGNVIMIHNWYKYNWNKSPKLIKALRDTARYISSKNFREKTMRAIDILEGK